MALNADYRGVEFTAHPVAPEPVLDVDRQLLGSAVMNLLNNAFKFTRVGGQVALRTFQHGDRFRIEVEDECGGIPEHQGDLFRPFTECRGSDRSGLGLGLSIARKAAEDTAVSRWAHPPCSAACYPHLREYVYGK
jgi:signal transduction histidine kinase